MEDVTVEEILARIESKAALLRYVNDLAARDREHPDADALSGAADVAGDIQELARRVRRSLGVDALMEIARGRRAGARGSDANRG